MLTGWHPITDITDAFAIPYETIRKAAVQASTNNEGWAKRGGYPCRWLINTDSAEYQRLLEIWTAEADENTDPWEYDVHEQTPCPPPPPPDVLRFWPELCAWLHQEGVLIFSNVLDGTQSWQWQWGELAGSGCASIADAILAALQSKIPHLNALAEVSASTYWHDEPARKPWFRRERL